MEAIIIFFLLWEIRKILRVSAPNPVWDRRIKLAMYVSVALFLVDIFFKIDPVLIWVWDFIFLSIVSIIYFNPALAAVKTLMYAFLPYVLLSFLNDVFKTFFLSDYRSIQMIFQIATIFTVVWMIAMLFVSKKQQKALEKEKLKTQLEEQLNAKLAEQKANLENLVADRTSKLVQQKDELENALIELRATQAQLIQQEKLASLGDLTAGIAHEIQNPLNFVNNFSEVNSELIDELYKELQEGNKQEAISIAGNIKENERKIVYHGKRADAIVKSMLQHSRRSNGTKEPVDINELADEYLRLSYHGLRAKDKSFNATIKTDFNKNIEKVNVIPQDIGRVLLNLYNNAFYAATEKKKHCREAFEPTVSVSTKQINGTVEIRVKDNGRGISGKVLDKIFQPFFTTKPTGQGTGLGLSLSYDIIKAHGGDLKVETKEGKGAEFIIELPLKG